MSNPSEEHYNIVAKAISEGRVVPFLGAGVNLYCRPNGVCYQLEQQQFLPNGSELAEHLSRGVEDGTIDKTDLLRVSQYIAIKEGTGPLYCELHDVFDCDYPWTPLHDFLANLPAVLREQDHLRQYQLIVTTNYDDLLERAFREAGESFDLVTYVAEDQYRGKFFHWPPEKKEHIIEKPNEYLDLSLDTRTVILKIHGTVDRREGAEQDSYVITEDHYIDYLSRTDISNLIPVTLAAKLRKSHFLFLGYSLRDWNLRVILHRIWGERKLTYKSWAIQLNPDAFDTEFWRKRDVEIIDVTLEQYITTLREHLQEPARVGGAS